MGTRARVAPAAFVAAGVASEASVASVIVLDFVAFLTSVTFVASVASSPLLVWGHVLNNEPHNIIDLPPGCGHRCLRLFAVLGRFVEANFGPLRTF